MENPVRPCENHDLHMDWEATRLESCCKQYVLSKAIPTLLHSGNILVKVSPGHLIHLNKASRYNIFSRMDVYNEFEQGRMFSIWNSASWEIKSLI